MAQRMAQRTPPRLYSATPEMVVEFYRAIDPTVKNKAANRLKFVQENEVKLVESGKKHKLQRPEDFQETLERKYKKSGNQAGEKRALRERRAKGFQRGREPITPASANDLGDGFKNSTKSEKERKSAKKVFPAAESKEPDATEAKVKKQAKIHVRRNTWGGKPPEDRDTSKSPRQLTARAETVREKKKPKEEKADAKGTKDLAVSDDKQDRRAKTKLEKSKRKRAKEEAGASVKAKKRVEAQQDPSSPVESLKAGQRNLAISEGPKGESEREQIVSPRASPMVSSPEEERKSPSVTTTRTAEREVRSVGQSLVSQRTAQWETMHNQTNTGQPEKGPNS